MHLIIKDHAKENDMIFQRIKRRIISMRLFSASYATV